METISRVTTTCLLSLALPQVSACAENLAAFPCSVSDNGDGTKTIACSDGTSATVSDGQDGEAGSCSVIDNGEGTKTIACSDGTSVTVSDGQDGASGSSCSVVDNRNGTATVSCTNGTSAVIANGLDGGPCSVTDNGNGTKTLSCDDGSSAVITDGRDGDSCSVTDNGNGTATVACTDGSSVVIADGSDGTSCSVTDNGDGTRSIDCTDGTSATVSDGVDSIEEINVMARALRTAYGAAVLDVWCYSGASVIGVGTGTKTSTGTILTAHHVVESCDAAEYYSGPTYVGGGGSWAQYGDRDTVEISAIGWNAGGLQISGVPPYLNATPELGEIVYNLGYPGLSIRNDVQVAVGRVVDDNVNDSLSASFASYWLNACTTDYAATGGSSGSPVFDRWGNFIAIHVGGFDSGLELNYSLPLQP